MERLLEPETFDLPAKNPSEEALRKWINAVSFVRNRRRRFRYAPNLEKREEAREQIEKTRRLLEPETFDLPAKNPSEEALRKRRNAVRNRRRRFRYAPHLKKRKEAREQIEKTRIIGSAERPFHITEPQFEWRISMPCQHGSVNTVNISPRDRFIGPTQPVNEQVTSVQGKSRVGFMAYVASLGLLTLVILVGHLTRG